MLKKSQFINILVVVIVIVAGFFIFKQFNQPAEPIAPKTVDLTPLKQSLATRPTVGEVELPQAKIDQYLSQYDAALEQVKKVNFDTLQGVNQIAQIKKSLGDYDGAIKAWQYANAIRPKNSLSFSNLASLYQYDLHEFDKAETQYQISIANDPGDISTIRNFYELYFYDLKDNSKAESLLLDSIKKNPDNADLLSLTGRFYADTGDNAKAIEYYQKHLELSPGNTAARKEIERLRGLDK